MVIELFICSYFAQVNVVTYCVFYAFVSVLICLCIILGIMDGFFICLIGPIAFDLVGARNASQAMGFLLAMISIPLMIGPMIGGQCTASSYISQILCWTEGIKFF